MGERASSEVVLLHICHVDEQPSSFTVEQGQDAVCLLHVSCLDLYLQVEDGQQPQCIDEGDSTPRQGDDNGMWRKEKVPQLSLWLERYLIQ